MGEPGAQPAPIRNLQGALMPAALAEPHITGVTEWLDRDRLMVTVEGRSSIYKVCPEGFRLISATPAPC